MEISRLHRTATIVARGAISADEIRTIAQRLADAHVRSFAKIVEVAGASTELTAEQIGKVAEVLHIDAAERSGPVAFIVDPDRTAFPRAFARLTRSEGPVQLFRSLRDARSWLEEIEHASAQSPPGHENASPWTDPGREGLLIRGDRQRAVTVSSIADYIE